MQTSTCLSHQLELGKLGEGFEAHKALPVRCAGCGCVLAEAVLCEQQDSGKNQSYACMFCDT